MFAQLKRLLSHETVETINFTQLQREALIDLLLLGMYADNLLSLPEHEFLEDEMDEIVWESPVSLSAYLGPAIHKIRSTDGDLDKRQALIQSIKQRLGDDTAKHGALLVLERLFSSDGIVPEEHALMSKIRSLF